MRRDAVGSGGLAGSGEGVGVCIGVVQWLGRRARGLRLGRGVGLLGGWLAPPKQPKQENAHSTRLWRCKPLREALYIDIYITSAHRRASNLIIYSGW